MRGVDCYTCRKRQRCNYLPTYQRKYCIEFYAKGNPEPHCPIYEADHYHGIDGVLTATDPPRPHSGFPTNNKSSYAKACCEVRQ